jgi:hypothetical protein
VPPATAAVPAAKLHTWPVPAFSIDSAAMLATSLTLPDLVGDGDNSSEASSSSRPHA